MKLPIQDGMLLIIPLMETDDEGSIQDFEGLPEFIPYEIVDTGVTMETLAKMFDADVQDILYYNGLPEEYQYMVGEWVIVPYTMPPFSHSLDVPIGGENKYIIHSVLSGNSLEQLAIQYHTTVEAIQRVNYTLELPISIGMFVIVPMDIENADVFTRFEAYRVTDRTLTIELLAKELKVDQQKLKLFNAIEDGYEITEGEWIIVPRS